MSFQLTAVQKNALKARITSQNGNPAEFSDPSLGSWNQSDDYWKMYQDVLDYMDAWEAISGNEFSLEDKRMYIWLEGVIGVNKDVGNQSEVIRYYNSAQAELRFEDPLSKVELDKASDQIAFDVIDRMSGPDSFPTVEFVAGVDVQTVSEGLLGNDKGAWAGNPLLLFLGYDDAFQENILETPGDTYDLLAAAKFLGEASAYALVENDYTPFFSLDFAAGDFIDLTWGAWDTAQEADAAAVVEANLQSAQNFLGATYGENANEVLISMSYGGIYLGNDDDNLLEDPSLFFGSVLHGGNGDDTIIGSEGNDLIDGGDGNDWLDYTGLDFILYNDIKIDLNEGKAHINYIFNDDDQYIYNIENIKTGGGDDILIGASDTKELHAGAGNDILMAGGVGTQLYGGTGGDILYGSSGAQLWGGDGSGHEGDGEIDIFAVRGGEVIKDADNQDYVFMYAHHPITGGIKWAPFEDNVAWDPSGFAYRVLDGDINDAEGGTLEIKYLWDSSSIITIEHYNRDFATHQGDGRIEIYAEVYGERGSDWVHNYIKSNAAAFGNEVGDPLVLDLDGNGYDLRSNTGSNVYFNIEGGEIAHRVGWVSGNDGFLVRDTNANGTIDDVSELFGNTNTSGFAQLAAYDNDNIPFIQHSKEYTQIVC